MVCVSDVAGNGLVCERDNQSALGPLVVLAACPTNRHYQSTGVDHVYPTLFALLFLPTPNNGIRSFQVSVHLVEASDHIMGSFDEKLISYTTRLLENRKVIYLGPYFSNPASMRSNEHPSKQHLVSICPR